MTPRERAGIYVRLIAAEPERAEALIEQALRDELRYVAVTLSSSADKKEKMYKELGLHGEDQARPYREIAQEIQRRAEL